MKKTRTRTYNIDGDILNAALRYDEPSGLWIEEYIDFKEIPRYTPNGRPWVDITCGDECSHCDAGNDGGACSFFQREKDKDLIAVCFCDALRINAEKVSKHSTNGGNET